MSSVGSLCVQEFNLEKLNLLETEKQRIRKEYERKEAQVEANKKMCVLSTLFRAGSIARTPLSAKRAVSLVPLLSAAVFLQRVVQAAQSAAPQGVGRQAEYDQGSFRSRESRAQGEGEGTSICGLDG